MKERPDLSHESACLRKLRWDVQCAYDGPGPCAYEGLDYSDPESELACWICEYAEWIMKEVEPDV